MVSNKRAFKEKLVTRKEYLEYGSNICSTRFDTPRALQEGRKEVIDVDDMY